MFFGLSLASEILPCGIPVEDLPNPPHVGNHHRVGKIHVLHFTLKLLWAKPCLLFILVLFCSRLWILCFWAMHYFVSMARWVFCCLCPCVRVSTSIRAVLVLLNFSPPLGLWIIFFFLVVAYQSASPQPTICNCWLGASVARKVIWRWRLKGNRTETSSQQNRLAMATSAKVATNGWRWTGKKLEWSGKNTSLLSVDWTFIVVSTNRVFGSLWFVVSTNRVFGSLWFCRWFLVIRGEKAPKKHFSKTTRNRKTPDLTQREFFNDILGEKDKTIKPKHRQKGTKTH